VNKIINDAQLCDQIYSDINKAGNQIRNQVSNQIGNQVRNKIIDQVSKKVGIPLCVQIWYGIQIQLRNQVMESDLNNG
jgi:hypothetical protein